jgi:ATP-binding cassette subfamily B protein
MHTDPDISKAWVLRLVPYFAKFRLLIFGIAIASLFATFFQVAIPALLGNTIDALGTATSAHDSDSFRLALYILIVVGVMRSVMNYAVRTLLYRFSYKVETLLRMAVFGKINYLPLSFFSKMKPGDLISRSNSDMGAIQIFLLYVPYNIIVFLTFILSIVYMLSISVKLALISILSLPLTFLLSLRLRKVVYPLSWLIQARTADLTTAIDENIKGHAVVASFAKESQQERVFRRLAIKLRWANEIMFRKKAIYAPLIEHLVVLNQICVLLYGGWLVIDEQMLLGDLVAFNMYIAMMMIPFATLGDVLIMGRNASSATQRVFEVIDEKTDSRYEQKKRPMPLVIDEVSLSGVSFAYGGPEVEVSDGSVLDQFNCHFKRGEMTAVVGRTGCGKSTLAMLLARFHSQKGGCISIDGVNIDEIGLESYRENVCLVHQQGFLFADTIRNNIAYARPEASWDEVLEAAKIAQVDKFVNLLPLKYDTMVGENGADLSGGQRQRINIAQAILANPSVLILDEATSALDLKTENDFLRDLRSVCKDKIIIFISHRLSVAEQADKVVFIERGKVKGDSVRHVDRLKKTWYADFFRESEQVDQSSLRDTEFS